MANHYQKAMFGRENQQAETPDDVMEQIEKLFNEGL